MCLCIKELFCGVYYDAREHDKASDGCVCVLQNACVVYVTMQESTTRPLMCVFLRFDVLVQ